MTAAHRKGRAAGLDGLARALAAIVEEARGHVAAGRDPNAEALAARIRAAAARERGRADTAAVDGAERQALKQLEQVIAVHRARTLVAKRPAAKPASAGPQRHRALLRTRPTITGTMDVHRLGSGEAPQLGWPADAAVASWEVRFSERPDPRSGYVLLETLTLDGTATSVAVPLGDRTLRVNLLGHGRDGRVVRRALISALTRDSWGERWQRRATAS
jgi:hypothetical protein